MRNGSNVIIAFFILLLFGLLLIGDNPSGGRRFDGTDDYVKISTTVKSIPMTIEFWIKQKEPWGNEWNLCVGEDYPAAAVDWMIVMPASDAVFTWGKLTFCWFVTNWNGVETTNQIITDIEPGVWTHVACTRNGVPLTIKIYINGVSIPVSTLGQEEAEPSLLNVPRVFHIGGRLGAANSNAEYDEVRVWNIERSQNEIISTMFRSLQGDHPGLRLNFTFDEKVGMIFNKTFYYTSGDDTILGTTSTEGYPGQATEGE